MYLLLFNNIKIVTTSISITYPIDFVMYLPRWVKLHGHKGVHARGQYTATLRVERAAMAAAH